MSHIIKPTGAEWSESRPTGQPGNQAARFALSEYANEWHFFNHGAFFTHAGFNYPHEDPVADWYEAQPIGTELLLQPFARTIIDGLSPIPGLGALTWGNVICGVRIPFWQSLHEFLGGACSIDREAKLFAKPFSGDLVIPDPVLVERYGALSSEITTITLTVFCIDSNQQRVEVRPAVSPTAPLRMVAMPPRPEVVALGDAVLAGDLSGLASQSNSAFQRHLDLYNALRVKELANASVHRFTDQHRGEMGAARRQRSRAGNQ